MTREWVRIEKKSLRSQHWTLQLFGIIVTQNYIDLDLYNMENILYSDPLQAHTHTHKTYVSQNNTHVYYMQCVLIFSIFISFLYLHKKKKTKKDKY